MLKLVGQGENILGVGVKLFGGGVIYLLAMYETELPNAFKSNISV